MGGGEKRRPENDGKSGQQEPTKADDRELYNSPKPKKIQKVEEDDTFYPHEGCIQIKIEVDDQLESSAKASEFKTKYDEEDEILIRDDRNSCCHSPEIKNVKKVNIKIEIGVEDRDSTPVPMISNISNAVDKKVNFNRNPSLPVNEIEIIDLTEDPADLITIDSETDDDVSEIGRKGFEEPATNALEKRASIKVETQELSPTFDAIEIDEETDSNVNDGLLVKVEESALAATVFVAAPDTDNDVSDIGGERFEELPSSLLEKRESIKVETEELSPTFDGNEVEEETDSNVNNVLVEESPLTATVYIAAPLIVNHNLEIIGEDKNLGEWAHPQGKFESVIEINADSRIFKGIIPIPSRIRSKFKFVHTTTDDNTIEYEGDGQRDNRTDELLPDTWNFFIFKTKSNKSVISKFLRNVKTFNQKSEPREEITFEFFNIVFNHTWENLLPDWNRAFDFLVDSLQKITKTVGACSSGGFRHFLNEWVQKPELQVNFDLLILLLIGVYKMDIYSPKLKEVLELKSKEFSKYLSNFITNVKLNHQDFNGILENIAIRAGREFWWILFRINRHSVAIKRHQRKELFQSILKSLEEIPEVLLDNSETAARVVDFLIQWNDIDELYFHLRPILAKSPKYKHLLDPLLLKHLLIHKTSIEDLRRILRSDFMSDAHQTFIPKEITGVNGEEKEKIVFDESLKFIFNQSISNLVKLACCTPIYMLPVVVPVVEEIACLKLKEMTNFNKEDYRFFAELEESGLKNFPQTKKLIESQVLDMAAKHVKLGFFQDVPSLKLILLGLAQREDTLFLVRPNIVDLQNAMGKLPRKFFQNLHLILKKPGACVDKVLKPFRKGETKDIVEKLENHFDQLEEILNKIQSRSIPMIEFAVLQDPQVLDCLKGVGFTERKQADFRQEVQELRGRRKLFELIYSRFARLNVITTREAKTDEQLEDGEEDVIESETIQILHPQEWEEGYLKAVDSARSSLTLKEALDLSLPLQMTDAQWLFEIKDCSLFMNKVWKPMVKDLQGIKGCVVFMDTMDSTVSDRYPLCKEDFHVLVCECASEWKDLARSVAEGTASFQQMEEIIRISPDPDVLSRKHLHGLVIEGVSVAYGNFKTLQELRHFISPFVTALRFFTIRERGPIENMYHFVQSNLLNQWETMTLAQITEKGILRILQEDLNIDSERPETREAMQFVSSLVTDGNSSPLIEWLREKNENDMEAMGKILQGTLLVAYGQLQTLRTRIAPFLQKEFKTYRDLLKVVRVSEERFAQRLSGRVQPIDCKWLANMLPEIQAAVRASVISPSEDAKEKLAKLRTVVIDPQNESYSIEIRLEPTGSLSMEELKQAFQLLDMAVDISVADGSHNTEDLVGRTRRNVGQIEQLSEVFGLLFASGCISYTFRKRIIIKLADLEKEIHGLRAKLAEWNQQWKEIEEMHLLALFSRGYLLQLADLIGRNKIEDVLSILRILLPSATVKMETLVNHLVQEAPRISDTTGWLSTAQLFQILRDLHRLIEAVFNEKSRDLALPAFLISYGRTLKSHFIDKSVVILNVSRELLVGSALAAYISLTRQTLEPSRILFVTTNTDKLEVERFMKLWSVANVDKDFFIIVHVERLTVAGASAVRDGVDRVLPERRTKLLLLAQHHHRVQSTKSLGARLGLISDRLLEINFTADQLRQCFSSLLPNAANLHFFTSKLPGCGKSQQAMQKASNLVPSPDYYRICVRIGSVEELLASLKQIENLSSQSRKRFAYLHLDIAHSVSLEFNDILISLLIHGALYDPKKAKLGFWLISPQTSIALEFASPFGVNEFPIIAYLGKHKICECEKSLFTYDLAEMPLVVGQPIFINRSNALVAAGKFLRLKEDGQGGLHAWDTICLEPETISAQPFPEELTFDLLVAAFQHPENRTAPTFTALNAMASFLYRHISAMIHSMWFNGSAVHLFEREDLARVFKLNVFNMLLKVANDSSARCWSMVNHGKKLAEMDWTNRQRAMFLLGLDEHGLVTGMNIVGRDAEALKNMFHASLLPILQQQCLRFQELRGFRNLMENPEGTEVILNAMRSLLLLDGTTSSILKVHQMDSHPKNTPASQRLLELTGKEQGYVLTGDNITKMMFALYRIRCGLPVVAFGEAGVGKSALFRFLIQTLLGHTFEVFNVNSGTSIQHVKESIECAITIVMMNPEAQVFLFFDEMNTADPPVIAFFKELMLDRHCHGTVLPKNLHLMGAANPYRFLQETDKEAAVGLAFRFAQPTQDGNGASARTTGDLVYRVNELPIAFYDHIYDFGHLCSEAEDTYIDEICQHGLPLSIFFPACVKWFSGLIQKSHRVARALSVDPESAVSLRDATRAVQLFRWFCQSPAGQKLSRIDVAKASDLTIYLVYAFRFRNRKIFLENVFGKNQTASKNMTEVSRIIAQMLYEQAHGASIGSGAIALNDALCENLFALYVCVLNGIFLIIVGRPGSSKSLSVEILKLVLSPGNHTLRHSLGDLPAITELYFQCSPLSTSSGFKALFESAQRLSVDPKTMLAMVVLDELGLADMSPEKPIKVLHAELERQSVLTSGEKQQSPYSVVALSNWVVDAAQVNRGILILRTQADKKDLLGSAEQLADSLIAKYVKESKRKRIRCMLTESLTSIVNTYEELDKREDIGGGHFFSMRDFFFCVKNFVCSVFESANRMEDFRELNISQHFLIQSVIRNFGGHEKARNLIRNCMADYLRMNVMTIPITSPLDLIVSNIQDSSKPLSIHIARHLMILNRSLIGLQLLNRHVKSKLENGMSWNVLFGSCFPGDLQVTAVTRKLRQVEQAIRTGGVLILCHADQLFESLYMVLNQQYWAQGEVTMTQIALGPSIRAIALPSGPFRIIALQDTDVALNRELMSPAILSRFEKHELRPSHLLDDAGQTWLNGIESHSVWLAVPEAVKRQKLISGYHEESFASLALHLQDRGIPMEVEQDEEEDPNSANTIWMRAVNPMAMIKLELDSITRHPELQGVCRRYRHSFVLESLDDALQNIKSKRIVVMTNTLRHLEIKPIDSSRFNHAVIQLFDVQTELELVRQLESISDDDLSDPDFCLLVQYDAVTGPIEQFQLAKYEVEQRFEKTECRVIFIVHVDPRPAGIHWVFSFGDSWDYCFVDEVVHSGPADQHKISLRELVQSPTDQPLSSFIEKMSIDSFKSLLLEMLGPVLQTSLASLRLSLGHFYSGVRTALGLQGNKLLIELLKECLLAQLMKNQITWNVVDAVNDASFDSSSSLTEGLWGVFKHKISNPLAHLLLVSDVWRISDQPSTKLWCDFVNANYPDRLMSLNSSDSLVQMPIGFRTCTQPFGRLLASFDIHLNGPLQWLLDRVAKSEDAKSKEIKEAYFLDWFLLRIPPHLHHCLKKLPLSKMSYIVDNMFEDPKNFFIEWEQREADVVAALELVSIASFAKADVNDGDIWGSATGRMRNWTFFTEAASRLSLTSLASSDTLNSQGKFMQAVSSIEVSPALSSLLDRVDDLPQVWLGLRIMKCILLFDPESKIKLPDLQVSTPKSLFEKLTELVVTSIIRPRVATGNQARRFVRQADLYALLKSTSTCDSPKELAKILRECPTNNSIVLVEENGANVGHCSSCTHPLIAEENEIQSLHLMAPSAETIELLFQDHQKFMFFFERVAELFIQQHKNNPHDVRDFLQFLLSSDSRLRVSWRFLTVIIRTVLSTRSGVRIIDELLLAIRCNWITRELNVNVQSFLRASIACADQDVWKKPNQEPPEDVIQAAMTGDWTVNRIRKLALVRQQLAVNAGGAETAIIKWSRWRKNQTDQSVTDALLFFILRFTSGEGDQTRLSNMLRHPRIAKELSHHKFINDYIAALSPLSLGFPLQSADFTANPFQERLMNGSLSDVFAFQHYPVLLELQPDWAPFIARLAYHANDVFVTKKLCFLRVMTTNLVASAEFLLPGVDNHPYLPSFNLEPTRWYLCSCGTLNCVGNCGRPMTTSTCVNCRVALGHNHVVRAGVRSATVRDFQSPHGFHVTRAPALMATFFVRNCSPIVTRFALLLNSLALMNAALNPRTIPEAISQFLLTLPPTERKEKEDRRSFIQLLSNHIVVHLDLLCQLLVTSRPQLSMTDKFRIGHLLLHKLLNSIEGSFSTNAANYASGPRAREDFENGLSRLLIQQTKLDVELDNIAGPSKAFHQSLLKNETSYWAYARRVFADRQSIQLELARNGLLRLNFPFLNFLLDDDNGMRKLNALQYLGEAMRFVALVRTVLLGEITQEEANRMSIAQGLEKITEIVLQKTILLDRGRPVASRDHVMHLFDGFKQLWDRFSQLENAEKKTFLDYFECQQVDVNVRPKTVLDETAPVILICAGSELPETTFSCQLLSHAVEAASSIALTDFIQPLCRAGSGRVRISCNSAAALADFDESLYAHVSTEEVDRFIRDHVIDRLTLQLAESFAVAAVLGSAGSTIAEDLALDVIPEFVFKDDMESGNYLVVLERRSIVWQPSSIPPQLQELILADLEKNRSLAEARSVLISAITHLHSNTEPLIISKVRNHYISDVLEELMRAEILTERHMSNATLSVLNRYLRLQVRHVFGLLKAIMARMKGDDIFGGRIPEGWTAVLSEDLAKLTSQKLRVDAEAGGILDTLLQMVNIVTTSQPVPVWLTPENSLLYAIRQIEGPEWDGIPDELKMENLGHLLLIAESLAKK